MTLIDFAHARRQMVQRQLRRRGIGDARVLAAMGRVPREQFLPPPFRDQAYADCALAIDCGQTISQPYMVALMTEALQLSGGEKVLEIGTGSGYQAAVLAELARQVVTIERYAELSARAAAVLDELGYRNVTLLTGDGTLGWPADAPYDRILVTAAAQRCRSRCWRSWPREESWLCPSAAAACRCCKRFAASATRSRRSSFPPAASCRWWAPRAGRSSAQGRGPAQSSPQGTEDVGWVEPPL